MTFEQIFDYCASCNYLEPIAVYDWSRDGGEPELLCAECAEKIGVN